MFKAILEWMSTSHREIELNKELNKTAIMLNNESMNKLFYREKVIRSMDIIKEKDAYIEQLEHRLSQYTEHEVKDGDDEGAPMPSTKDLLDSEKIEVNIRGTIDIRDRLKAKPDKTTEMDAKINGYQINEMLGGSDE